MSKEGSKKAAYAVYYAADGSVVKRVDFQEAGKHVTSRVKSGMFFYRKGIRWRNAKRKAKIRDNHRCCECGSEKNLQVHHIKSDPALAFTLSNLKTLCIDCHNREQKL
jgi:hypothetical protein